MQHAYAELLKVHVGPALRTLGFKGSRGKYSFVSGEYRADIDFQKSVHSTRDVVLFTINLGVTHQEASDHYWEAVVKGFGPSAQIKVRTDGIWWGTRIYELDYPRIPDWYRLNSTTDVETLGGQVVEDVRTVALPVMTR